MIVPDDAFITASLIMDSDPSTWAPEFERPEARECFYGCGPDVVAVFNDMYGITQGVCAKDRSLVDGQTYDIPAPMISTVCVVQNTPGMVGRAHYHAPGCRDIQREMRKWGQTEMDLSRYPFSDVASILDHEYGDIAADTAERGTDEWWAEVMFNASHSHTRDESFGVKIMSCLSIPMGRVGNSPLVFSGGMYRAGFDAPSQERVEAAKAEIMAHDWSTCSDVECIICVAKADMLPAPVSSEDPIISTKPAGYRTECDGFDEYGNTCGEMFMCKFCETNSDAGFVEHMTTRDYLLSVIVDESTGATVDLGWVSLTLNSAHHSDHVKIAEAYGKLHGIGTPRNGWASIIVVHDMD